MATSLRLLLVEDSVADADLLNHFLSMGDYEFHSHRVDSEAAMKAALDAESWDIIISDYNMRGFSGLDALAVLTSTGKDIPFILVSGTAGEDIAVAAMRAGASDFFSKTKLKLLLPAVQRELRAAASRAESREKDIQLRQAQKMEVVGRLAGGVAHDFNNLLAVISLYADSIMDEMGADDPIRESMGEVIKATERGAGLTRQLLVFSREQKVELKLLDLNKVVSGLRAMLQRLISEEIELVFKLSEGPQLLRADAGQLEQIIMNLVVNARDAIQKGGKITVITESIQDLQRSFVKVSVVDTGVGMDEKTKLKIFEPFFTTKEVGQGTGLGLSIVFALVKDFNGSVSVESHPGKGSTFVLLFEKQEGSLETTLIVPQIVKLTQETIRVLLVEDEEALRLVLARTLRKEGYTVLTAAHGREALSLLQDHSEPIDLVVSDVVMPEMNGCELVEKLRESVPHLKVLYISGYLGDKLKQYNLSDSSTFLMDKPFKIRVLLDKISEILKVQAESCSLIILQ